MTRLRLMAARAVLLLGAPLLIFGIAELSLWAAGVVPHASDPDQLNWRKHRACQFARVGASVCDASTLPVTGRRLVVAIGGSSVQGYPRGHTVPFPEHLGALLNRGFPGQYEVVNRGLFCKDSIYVRDCALASLEAPVDTLVVYAGHNDYANWGLVSPARAIFLEEHSGLLRGDEWLARSRLYSWALDLTGSGRSSFEASVEIVPEALAERSEAIVRAKTRENLEAIITAARAAKTQVLLVTVVSNLSDFPVKLVEWDRAVVEREHPGPEHRRWIEAYDAGVRAFRSRDWGLSLSEFRRARDAFPRGRAPTAHNELLAELAREHEHVQLVDFASALERHFPGRGIGCNFFGDDTYCDQFHPNTRTQRTIAKQLAEAIVDRHLAGTRSAEN